MSVTIECKSDELMTDARMLSIKSQFHNKGFKDYPSSLIAESCPYKSPKSVNQWMIRAGNVWRLRSRDVKIIKMFEDVLEKLKTE